NGGRVHNLGAAGNGGERQATAERFRSDDKIGLDAVTFAGEHSAGTPEARLDFVGNKKDAVLVAKIDQDFEVLRRRGDESAFAQDWLRDDRRDFFVGNHALESIFEMACAKEIARRIFQVIRAAIAVGERNAINVARKRSEAGLVRMSFAGESESHHGAAVEGVFEGYDRGTLRVG